MQFKPHGDTRIQPLGRVLRFEPQGTANAEEISRVMSALQGPLAALSGRPWGALVALTHDDDLMTPDAETLLGAWAERLCASGLTAVALSGRAPDELWIVATQFRRAFAGTNASIEVIGDLEQARAWLEAQLPSLNTPSRP